MLNDKINRMILMYSASFVRQLYVNKPVFDWFCRLVLILSKFNCFVNDTLKLQYDLEE